MYYKIKKSIKYKYGTCLSVSSLKIVWTISASSMENFKTVGYKKILDCQNLTYTRDGLFYWRKCYYGLWSGILARSNGLKLKHLNGRLLQIHFDEETNSSKSCMAWGLVHFQQIFILGLLYFFKAKRSLNFNTYIQLHIHTSVGLLHQASHSPSAR